MQGNVVPCKCRLTPMTTPFVHPSRVLNFTVVPILNRGGGVGRTFSAQDLPAPVAGGVPPVAVAGGGPLVAVGGGVPPVAVAGGVPPVAVAGGTPPVL